MANGLVRLAAFIAIKTTDHNVVFFWHHDWCTWNFTVRVCLCFECTVSHWLVQCSASGEV